MKLILTYEIDNTWADQETLTSLTDEEVLELLNEDAYEVWENATKRIERT